MAAYSGCGEGDGGIGHGKRRSGPDWRELAGTFSWWGRWVSGGRAPSGWEWNRSQPGQGATELGFPRPALWQMQDETFPAVEARRIAKRLEFHYTPKHGSWLNMAEIEFSVLSRSCLRQRIPDQEALGREVQALVRERNAAQSIINWRFNTQNARTKLHRLYPFDSTVD